MKVSYSMSTGSDIKISHISTRVLTENLINNDKIDHSFVNSIIPMFIHTEEDMKHSKFTKIFGQHIRQLHKQKYNNDFIEGIKGDYFLYSMNSGVYDYPLISKILNSGFKVVLGGSEINLNSFENIQKNLILCGVKEKNIKNIIYVKGYITPYTDLHNIIQNWNNIEVDGNSKHIFLAKKDYTKIGYFNNVRKIVSKLDNNIFENWIWPNDSISIILNGTCIWNKCRFCRHRYFNSNFINEFTEEEIVDHIMKLSNQLQTKDVFIADSYFIFDDKNEKIIKTLFENGIRFIGQTGIQHLKNREFTKKISKYFHIICVGLETATDYSLKSLRKGFQWSDVEKAIKNISKYGNSNNIWSINTIIDVPSVSIHEVKLNYNRFLWIKKYIKNNSKTKFYFSFNGLSLADKYIWNNFYKFGGIRYPKENQFSGRYRLWYEIEKTQKVPMIFKMDGIPYERIDINKNLLKSDLDIIDNDVFNELFGLNI